MIKYTILPIVNYQRIQLQSVNGNLSASGEKSSRKKITTNKSIFMAQTI